MIFVWVVVKSEWFVCLKVLLVLFDNKIVYECNWCFVVWMMVIVVLNWLLFVVIGVLYLGGLCGVFELLC